MKHWPLIALLLVAFFIIDRPQHTAGASAAMFAGRWRNLSSRLFYDQGGPAAVVGGTGPIDESNGRVDFFWIDYRTTEGRPGMVHMKFGHAR